jgi:hypothetical protein
LLSDNVHDFSIQKSIKHRIVLYLSGGSLYASAFAAGWLPAYYFYNALCYDGDTFYNCSLYDLDSLITGITTLVLDTTLHYGHQLSHHAKHWIDHYFARQLWQNTTFSSAEITRQHYLQQFKDIQQLIDRSSAAKRADLYKEVVRNSATQETDPMKEVLHVLQELQRFHQQHKHYLKPEEPSQWKKTVSSGTGWIGMLAASVGRHLTFWHAVDELLETLEHAGYISGVTRSALSVIFGGIIAGLVQGWIEKDAIQSTVYNMLGGHKITEATSHGLLRQGIRIYNSFVGACATIPYMLVGFNMIEGCHSDFTRPGGKHCAWDWSLPALYLTLVPFGWANALNEGQAFNNSILKIVSAFDSLVSYCYPFEGYKRDKLMDIVTQLRELFKELHPDVLEAVDKLLNPDQPTDQRSVVRDQRSENS